MEIDGELHWEGGCIANPAINPLHEATGVHDTLIVQLSQLRVDVPPDEARVNGRNRARNGAARRLAAVLSTGHPSTEAPEPQRRPERKQR